MAYIRGNIDTSLLCKDPVFIIPAGVNLVISFMFIYVGARTTKSLNRIADNLMDLRNNVHEDNPIDDSRVIHRTDASIESIDKAKKNMWLIIISITIINVYSALYSIALLSEPPNQCHLNSVFAYNFTTIFTRLITLTIWPIPIVVVFWPKERTFLCCIREERKASYFKRPSESDFKPLGSRDSRQSSGQADSDSDDGDHPANVRASYGIGKGFQIAHDTHNSAVTGSSSTLLQGNED